MNSKQRQFLKENGLAVMMFRMEERPEDEIDEVWSVGTPGKGTIYGKRSSLVLTNWRHRHVFVGSHQELGAEEGEEAGPPAPSRARCIMRFRASSR